MDGYSDDTGSQEQGFWDRHGRKVILGGLCAYLLLLLIGTVAEIFDIQPVLDWWFWRPPGKPPGDFTP